VRICYDAIAADHKPAPTPRWSEPAFHGAL
jgi:hypothetical protein